MAGKNHLLDKKIINAAKEEFTARGFEKASMRKIAEKAGVTIGAIYTRYPSKEVLFASIVSPLLDAVYKEFSQIEHIYSSADPCSITSMAFAMTIENDKIIHLLFDHYESAVLLLCRSAGSGLENFFSRIVTMKIEKTITFFKNAGKENVDKGILNLLISAQYDMYYQIIYSGYSLDEAKKMTEAAMVYHQGGWLAFLKNCNKD